MQSLSKIYNSSPKQLVSVLRRRLKAESNSPTQRVANPSEFERNQRLLRERFSRFTVGNLQGVNAQDFRSQVEGRIGRVDSAIEGYSANELEKQRDLSIRFHWGHNHDFGEFAVTGRMRDRHVDVMAEFLSLYPVSLSTFAGKHVLDVGCWTGGTTLLLAALDASVLAIEEVKKYAQTVEFLVESFGLGKQVSVDALSVYQCGTPAFAERFDLVFFPGVIYHLSDPVVALRILYNSLKVDGEILVESAGINVPEPLCEFQGSGFHKTRDPKQLNRGGWNWFLPSPSALELMMLEVGFEGVQTDWSAREGRVYGYGKKAARHGICRAGLSVPDID